MLFLHPNALGIIGILRPSGVFCCPRAYGPWAAENTLRAENTNDPSCKGCKNLPSFYPHTIQVMGFNASDVGAEGTLSTLTLHLANAGLDTVDGAKKL